MDSPATPAHIGRREARREIQRTHMLPLHGSEELATRGDIQRSPSVDDGSASMLNCTITGDGSPASANQPSEPASIGTGHRDPPPNVATQAAAHTGYAWCDIQTNSWTHAIVMEFLEHYKVTPQGLAIAIDYHWNGRTLETIVNDDEAHAMLRDDLGIGSKLNRLALIAAVKEYSMPATVPEKAKTIGELIPQPQQRRLLLAGEKALEIPTIPVAAPGYSLPNHLTWKTFMTSVQVWNPSNAELFEEGQFQEKAYKASQTKGECYNIKD